MAAQQVQFIFPKMERENGAAPIVFDAQLDETNELNVSITRHPVERGASVVDHMRLEPEKLSMRVKFTDTPHDGSVEIGRSIKLAEQFRAEAGKGVVTFVNARRRWKDMAISRMTFARDATTGLCVVIDLSMEQIIFAESTMVLLPAKKIKPAKKTAATSKADKGQQSENANAGKKTIAAGTVDTTANVFSGGIKSFNTTINKWAGGEGYSLKARPK